MPIRMLPPEVAAKIAAGEVVERPASVVKELIENSIDAEARAISVEIREGGLSLVRVSDNGCGINRADLPLVLKRFATSKISSLEDLNSIKTLGFRGEAISSMAAVAKLEILSRTIEELEGTRLRAEGKDVEIEPAPSPVGTCVAVWDLFYNTPARRKFLKSPLREGELVRRTVVRYSLAYPHIAFRLVADGRERYVAPPARPLERIGTALGREAAAEMIGIKWEAAEVRVWGFISRPQLGRSNRRGQFFFLNGRPIRAGLLAVMLERPYSGRLPPGRHPLAVIYIEIDPHLVDVNVHPRKAEVRFAQERVVYQALSRAVEDALSPYPLFREAPTIAWPFEGLPFEIVREAGPGYFFGKLEALGQVGGAFIVAKGPDSLVIVDQHAAHEQALLERLLQGEAPHILTPPVEVEVTSYEAELLRAHLGLLAELGLEVEPFGGNCFLIRSLPPVVAGKEPAEVLTVLIEEIERSQQLDEEALRERLTLKAACFAAFKAGDLLSSEEMQGVLDGLSATWSPSTCPHGRPSFFILTLEEMERRLMRR